MVAARHREWVYDVLAPPLILATPFASFVDHNQYGYDAAEIWVSLTVVVAAGLLFGVVMLGRPWLRVLVTAGLLTLVVDLQFDWLDKQKYLRCLGLGLGFLLLCWLLREHLSRVAASAFAAMLVAGLLFQGGSSEWPVRATLGAAILRRCRDRHRRQSSSDLRRVHRHRRNSFGGFRWNESLALAALVFAFERLPGLRTVDFTERTTRSPMP